MKVTFAMANLAGRAKDWALGLNFTTHMHLSHLRSLRPGSDNCLSRQVPNLGLEPSIYMLNRVSVMYTLTPNMYDTYQVLSYKIDG